MIVDIIMGLFILGFAFDRGAQGTISQVMAQDGAAQFDSSRPVELDNDFAEILFEDLRCEYAPEPTPVLRRLMEEGLISPENRVDSRGYACFPFAGPVGLATLRMTSVCGGVMDMAESAENPDLYPSDAELEDRDRVQVLAFGMAEPVALMIDISRGVYGPRGPDEIGVRERLYTMILPERPQSEFFCDHVLVGNIIKARADASAGGGLPAPVP
ncbi:MAG: hypothetical protein Q4G26_11540 [Paracoccus sp. (in: a-proteobacteria)]|nr:hypothetical protein [Paracoccus sp. (in: a-proteobacteria)]